MHRWPSPPASATSTSPRISKSSTHGTDGARTHPPPSGALRLVIDNRYLERVQVSDIVPPPLRKDGGRERTAFVFESRPGAVPDRIVFRVKPEHAGALEARVTLDGGEALAFHQFVFP